MSTPSQRRSQAERSATTRAALIEAAIRTVAAQGVGKVSTTDVASAAGLTRGALQHHFSGIRDVWIAVLASAWQASLDAYLAAPTVDVPLAERIAGWVAATRAAHDTQLGRVAVELLVAHRADEEFLGELRPTMVAAEHQLDAQWCAAVADVLPDASEARRIRRALRDNALGTYMRSIVAPEDSAGDTTEADTDTLTRLVLALISSGQ